MTPCIEWPGLRNREGYGTVGLGGFRRVAHRLMWELYRGPVPEGMNIDHLCRNRACVNLDHLEVVTIRENVLRGVGPSAVNARRTHCVHGHLLDQNNVYFAEGRRRCRACGRARTRKYVARKRAAEATP